MLFILIALPFLAALVPVPAGRKNTEIAYYIALFSAAFEFLLTIFFALQPAQKAELSTAVSLGLHLETDGFRKVYTLLISFMWLMTLALSKEYFRGHHKLSRYYFFTLMTLGATMGVFLSADLFTALVFFEIMSFTSFPWVIQEETEDAIKAANTYLAIAVIGGLSALMGLFLLYNKLGTLTLSALYDAALACPDKPVLYTAGICILIGFGAKAGMFPLHIWLPKAHPVAPAPASALLSGVLTKSGIFGILAISGTIFRYDPAWGTVILVPGVITMFLGAVLALFSNNLKRTLACSSMSQIGFVLTGIGMMGLLGAENALAARGALLHMVNHSLFKLVLFMCAGVVYMNLHELDLNKIRGFGHHKPILNICFLLGALGISGIPGLNGYISKTLIHEAITEGAPLYGSVLTLVEWIFLISGGFTLAYMTKLYVCIFVEKPAAAPVRTSRCMTPLSAAALMISAAVLPVLGLHAPVLMNRIADIGTDFFHAGALETAVRYYSLESLKGAGISVLIGAFVYLVIVRKLLMKDGRYVNRFPAWLDPEEKVYRPLLLKVLPAVFGFIAALFGENKLSGKLAEGMLRLGSFLGRLFGENILSRPLSLGFFRGTGILSRTICDLPDAAVWASKKTVFRESRMILPGKAAGSVSFRLGALFDRIAARHGKEESGEERFARLFYRLHRTFVKTTHYLTDTMSFALFMLCLAICAVMIYIFLVRN